MDTYILVEGRPVKCSDSQEAMRWRLRYPGATRVEVTEVGDLSVSTVFLIHDHSMGGTHKPVLWETMVFKYDETFHSVNQTRCAGTIEDARRMHAEVVVLVKEGLE